MDFVMSADEAPFRLPKSNIGVDGSVLFIARPGFPRISIDAALLDTVAEAGSELSLTVGDTEVVLHVAEGAESVGEIVRRLQPYTREASIGTPDVYEDARRRLRPRTDSSDCLKTDYNLMVGDDRVVIKRDGLIKVGQTWLKLEHVEEQAARGETVVFPNGAPLQVALVLLVVAAEQRVGGREGLELLAERVNRYEEAMATRPPEPAA